MRNDIEVETIHHLQNNMVCDYCQHEMMAIGSMVVHEEAKFIPAKMMEVQHIEHVYECKACKRDSSLQKQMKRGNAP